MVIISGSVNEELNHLAIFSRVPRVKDKLFYNMKSSSLLMNEKPALKTHRRCSLRAENPSWETSRASAPLLHHNRWLCAIPPVRQVRGDTRSQEEGAADVASEGEQCSASCYRSGQNRSLNWRASPPPRINWGVLMDSEWINWWLSHFAVLTQCALMTQHTHVHHCGAMQMFTPMSWFVLYKGLANQFIFIKQHLVAN